MSVRPITVSEEIKAGGHPFTNIFALFGGLQGILVYLHLSKIPVTSNWFAKPHGSFGRFLFLAGGGYVFAGSLALFFYTDHALLRLS